MRFLFIIAPLIFITSCGTFSSNRSFLTEMEHDDEGFFNPRQDFPVVAGDSGRDWMNESERRRRTPASQQDLLEERSRRSLEQELRVLENSQSEHAFQIYEKHQHRLPTISEKIYFLKLHPAERMDYLEARGFLDRPQERRPATAGAGFRESMMGYRSSQLNLGMSKDDVRHTWGKPLRVEVAGNPSFENERWMYSQNGATKYIYFEGGRVEGWE